MPSHLPTAGALLALLAGCAAASDDPRPLAYAEPGCRDAPSTMTVVIDGHAVTRQWRECQQPDGSWRSVSLAPEEPAPMARRAAR